MEYSHEHLDQIIDNNPAAQRIEQYPIPDELLERKELILDQLKIVHQLFRKQAADAPSVNRLGANLDFFHSLASSTYNSNRTMAQKLAAARPYNYFLTRIQSSPQTHNEPLSITFNEIFDPSLGELECSAQTNFVVDPNWLVNRYIDVGHLDKPLLILYGRQLDPHMEQLAKNLPQITACFVPMPDFSTHHTKMMLLGYKDGSMRVIVSTANLYGPDWENRAQGLWMSEKLDAMASGSAAVDGESETEFRQDLITYLSSYGFSQLDQWIQRIRRTNFTSVSLNRLM